MGPSGIEPLTSSVSRKRSPSELRAPSEVLDPGGDVRNRTGVTGFADPCLIHSATSPCLVLRLSRKAGRAEDGARTRDLNLGKVALYQLSYFRVSGSL